MSTLSVAAWHERSEIIETLQNFGDKLGILDIRGSALREVQRLRPDLSEAELAALTNNELKTEPMTMAPRSASFAENVSDHLRKPKLTAPDGPYHRYLVTGDIELEVDQSLAPPRLVLDDTDLAYPLAKLDAVMSPPVGQKLTYFFEFDTSPDFDSPNFWRYPSMIPAFDKADLTGKNGLRYALFRSPIRDVNGLEAEVRFPFRVTAMAMIEDFDQLDFTKMVKFAQLAAYKLPRHQLINEFFQIGRYRYVWGDDDVNRRPIDTFKTGVAECNHVNDLIGTLLEINGHRYRIVSGFNPLVREVYPFGGHSAIEVFDETSGRWQYLDPYLDIMEHGVAAADFAAAPIGKTWIYNITDERFDQDRYGDTLDLAGLFRYRLYGDKADRLPMSNMLVLHGDEERYGTDWPLRQTDVGFDPSVDIDDTVTIHVRGRYVLSSCTVVYRQGCSDPDAKASPWAKTSFTIKPKMLLGE